MRCGRQETGRRRSRSGESIVEVVMSTVVFLLLMAVLSGAIAFCHSAMNKSEDLRRNNASLLKALESTPVTKSGDTAVYAFHAYAYQGDEIVEGEESVFSVEIGLGEKKAVYTDTKGNSVTVSVSAFTDKGVTPP